MIGSDNIALGPAFVIQEDYAVKAAPAALIRSNADVPNSEKKAAAAAIYATHQQLQPEQQQPKYVDPDGPIDPDSNQVSAGRKKSILGFQRTKVFIAA